MVITLQKKVPGPPSSLREHLKKRISIAKPKHLPLDPINKARVFINAKIAGASTSEAKALSALKGTAQQILDSPAAKPILDEIEKREELKDSAIVDRLVKMWDHKRKRLQKVGDDVEVIHEDDTDMWKYSMDKVLALKGHLKEDKDGGGTNIASADSVTFNVLQVTK